VTDVRLGRPGDGGAVLLVAEDGDRPVGSAVLHPAARDAAVRAALPGVPELSTLTVDPAEQRRGHGTALIRAAAHAVAADGRTSLAVAVADDNPDAARLYLRLGFRDTGLRAVDRWTRPDGTPVADPVRYLVLDLGRPTPDSGTDHEQ
jgi:ribosomal protein S18 acetylase RimI-like enzyme